MTAALRVLAYCDSPIHSGAEQFFARALADLQRQAAIELMVAVPAANTRLRKVLAAGGLPSRRLVESPGQPLRLSAFQLFDPRKLRRIESVLRAEQPEVLFLNVSSAEHGLAPLLTPTGARIPSVGLLHLHQRPRDFGARLAGSRERLARVGMRRLDTACTLSSEAARFTARQWLRETATVKVVPMPAPEVERVPRADARQALGLAQRSRIVGFAGRLVFAQKGLDVFIDAACELARTRPDLHFAIAGEGEDRDAAVGRIDALGMAERFSFLGQVGDMDLFLSAIDALAMPSRAEGLPLLALEALSLGVPGIASGVDGLLDVWPPLWQVTPGRPEPLVRAMAALLDAPPEVVERTTAEGKALGRGRTAGDLGPTFAAVLEATAGRPSLTQHMEHDR